MSGAGAIDWNCDNGAAPEPDTSVAINVNWDCFDTVKANCGYCDTGETGQLTVLDGYDDWPNLVYAFQNTDNFEDGMHVRVDLPDMTYPTYLLTTNQPPVANAGASKAYECSGPGGAMVLLDGSG